VAAHDDQAETVCCGASRHHRGLAGIRRVSSILSCRRADLRVALGRRRNWCEDATNRAIARNRVRHDLLPVIEHIAPGAVPALARAAALAEDDEDVLQAEAIKMAASIVLTEDATGAELDRERLRALPPAIARRVLRNVLERVAPRSAWTAGHLDAIRRLAGRRGRRQPAFARHGAPSGCPT
jgi:tRNA(Ile)-lysidine synthase